MSDSVVSITNDFLKFDETPLSFFPQVMVSVVLGNSKLSFAVTDSISQGSFAENRIHSSWFKQREIYYRVLNGLQNLLRR
jgi:hypothetical protein